MHPISIIISERVLSRVLALLAVDDLLAFHRAYPRVDTTPFVTRIIADQCHVMVAPRRTDAQGALQKAPALQNRPWADIARAMRAPSPPRRAHPQTSASTSPRRPRGTASA